MQSFVQQHAAKITGVLGCFDRLIFKGHLPISYAQGMERLLDRHGVLLKNFKAFAPAQAERIKEHAQALVRQESRPYEYQASLQPLYARLLDHALLHFGAQEISPSWARNSATTFRAKC